MHPVEQQSIDRLTLRFSVLLERCIDVDERDLLSLGYLPHAFGVGPQGDVEAVGMVGAVRMLPVQSLQRGRPAHRIRRHEDDFAAAFPKSVDEVLEVARIIVECHAGLSGGR